MSDKKEDYYEYHESPEDLYSDSADYHEATGDRYRAKRIRARRRAIEKGDINDERNK